MPAVCTKCHHISAYWQALSDTKYAHIALCTEPCVVTYGSNSHEHASIYYAVLQRTYRQEGRKRNKQKNLKYSTSDSQPSINVKPCNILIWLSTFLLLCHFFLVRFTHCICVSFVARVSLADYQEDEFQAIPYILHAILHACSGLVMLVVACRGCRQFG